MNLTTLIGIAVGVIMALFGIIHAIQNGRLGKLEDCLAGKGGIKETLVRIDERVKFLWSLENGRGEKKDEREISKSD